MLILYYPSFASNLYFIGANYVNAFILSFFLSKRESTFLECSRVLDLRVYTNSVKYIFLLFNRSSKPRSLKNDALPYIIIHHRNHKKKIGAPT